MKIRAISMLLVGLLCANLIGCSGNKPLAKAGTENKLDLAIKYMAEEKYDQAVLAYNDVIKIDPKKVEAYKGLSLAYSLQNNDYESRKALDQGLEALPGNPDLSLAMAGLLVDQNLAKDAESLYKQQIAAANLNYDMYKAYIRFLVDQKRAPEAIPILEKALRKNPKEYRLKVLYAEVYIVLGLNDQAREAALAAIDNEPNQSEAFAILEEVYQGHWPGFMVFADQYIKDNHIKTGSLLKMYGLIMSGQYEPAIEQYNNLPAEVKTLDRTQIWLGMAQMKFGLKARALETLNLIDYRQIKDATLIAELARLYMESGDKEIAREIALQGISIDSNIVENYAVLTLLGSGEQQKIWIVRWHLESSDSSGDEQQNLRLALEDDYLDLIPPKSTAAESDNKSKTPANTEIDNSNLPVNIPDLSHKSDSSTKVPAIPMSTSKASTTPKVPQTLFSFQGVTVDMTQAQVKSRLGDPIDPTPYVLTGADVSDDTFIGYTMCMYSVGSGVVTVYFNQSGKAQDIACSSLNGIKVDDPVGKVTGAFGQGQVVRDLGDNEDYALRYTRGGEEVYFSITNDQVSGIDIGSPVTGVAIEG